MVLDLATSTGLETWLFSLVKMPIGVPVFVKQLTVVGRESEGTYHG